MKSLFLTCLSICFLLVSCEKEYSGEGVPATAFVTTSTVTGITTTTALSGGNVVSDGGKPVIARGVCWSTSTGPTTALSTKTNDGTGTGAFSSAITGLLPDVMYYLRAYVITTAGIFYGTEKSFKTSTAPIILTVGSSYGGGIIGYVLQPGDVGYDPAVSHGIVIAPDYVTPIDWSLQDFGTFVLTNATGTAIGTGQANTTKIIAVEGPTGSYAAKYCDDLALNGYSDWYLPSKDELNALYLNRAAFGGFTYTAYWSSTESDLTGAHFLYTPNGTFALGYKGSPAYIRAVRSF